MDAIVSLKEDHKAVEKLFTQFEKPDKVGVAGFTTSMLREGTKTRSGEKLSLDLQLLGTNIVASVSGESGSLSFLATTDKFAPTLEIMADMLLNSTFPTDALERLRKQRLVQLAQANAQPSVIGNRVFSRVLYGHSHPFGYDANETTIKAADQFRQAVQAEGASPFAQSFRDRDRGVDANTPGAQKEPQP